MNVGFPSEAALHLFHIIFSCKVYHFSPHSIFENVKQFFLACFMEEETQLLGNHDSYNAKSY